jgi:hypothetical protein
MAFSGKPGVNRHQSMMLGPPESLADGKPGYAHRNQTFMHHCVFYANVNLMVEMIFNLTFQSSMGETK